MFSVLFPDPHHLLESYSVPSAPEVTQHRRYRTTSISRWAFRGRVTRRISLSPKEEAESQPIALVNVLVGVESVGDD